MKLTNSDLLQPQSFINGQWQGADSGETFPVYNPFDQQQIAEVSELGQVETHRAITAAHEAFLTWRHVPQSEKANILNRWADGIEEHTDDLAMMLTIEQGKPLAESTAEVGWSISHIRYCATDSLPITGEVLPSTQAGKQALLVKQPFGVVASITPWNFPILTAIEKTVYPITAGNTVVLKPSDETPLSTLAIAYLAMEAGLPDGVLNVVTAKNAANIGHEMTSNQKVQMLSFTGSTRVGKLLYAQAAQQVMKVNLELGGNSPLIVFPDADLEKAAEEAAILKYLNAGQVCVNLNRLFVHEAVYDEFAEKFTAHAQKIKIGSGLDNSVNMGPLLNQMGLDKTQELVNDAVKKGATLKCGGNARADLGPYFYEPTVLTDMTIRMDMYQAEIFGPIAPIYPFSDETEMLRQANDTEFGLAAYFYTRDLGTAWRVSNALETANISVNSIENYVGSPWGGHKESGIRGGSGRLHALEQYFDIKAIAMTM